MVTEPEVILVRRSEGESDSILGPVERSEVAPDRPRAASPLTGPARGFRDVARLRHSCVEAALDGAPNGFLAIVGDEAGGGRRVGQRAFDRAAPDRVRADELSQAVGRAVERRVALPVGSPRDIPALICECRRRVGCPAALGLLPAAAPACAPARGFGPSRRTRSQCGAATGSLSRIHSYGTPSAFTLGATMT